MPELLEITGLGKAYRGFALEGVDLALAAGTLTGLLGPNGAGKTTLLKAILGLARRQSGRIRFGGRDLDPRDPRLLQRIAYVADEPRFPPGASLGAIQAATAAFYPDFHVARWRGLMADFGLEPAKAARTLSLGERTRFALSLALARDPDLFILDEPTTGLDPVFRRELLQRITARLDERCAVLFSTHITSDLEHRADQVVFLRAGRVVLADAQETLKERWGLVKGPPGWLDAATRAGFRGLRETPLGFEALTDDRAGARARFPEEVLVEGASLEDVLVLLGRRPHAA